MIRPASLYPLSAISDDPALGKWLADTIPSVIEPGTWSQTQGAGRHQISYFPPGKVLVVYHTRAVQEKVDGLIKQVKKAVPAATAARPTRTDRSVVRTDYVEPSPLPSADAGPKTPYLVPPPLKSPKHLFHMILRYEGDGLVDANVTELIKGVTGIGTPKNEEKKDTEEKSSKASPLNQLMHFIVRYEGEGIIDSNVVALYKTIQAGQPSTSASPPVTAYSSNIPAMPAAGTVIVPPGPSVPSELIQSFFALPRWSVLTPRSSGATSGYLTAPPIAQCPPGTLPPPTPSGKSENTDP